jgi:hypothetical protein
VENDAMSETLLSEVETDVPAAWLTIGSVLRDRMISNVAQLAQTLAFETATVREGLEYWVSHGMVEVLRPYNGRQPFDDELDYYRWKQSSDRDFLWEQTI